LAIKSAVETFVGIEVIDPSRGWITAFAPPALDQGRGPKLQASRTVGAGLALPRRGRDKQRPYGGIPAEATTQPQPSSG